MEIRHSANSTAAEWLGKIEPGFRQFGFTMGQWSVGEVLEQCIGQIGIPGELDIVTWRLNSYYVDLFVDLMARGVINRLRLVVDRSMPTFADNKERCKRISSLIGDENIRVAYSHAKASCYFAGDWAIALQTSANMNANIRIEQVNIEDNRDVARSIKAVVDEVFAMRPPGWRWDGTREEFSEQMTLGVAKPIAIQRKASRLSPQAKRLIAGVKRNARKST